MYALALVFALTGGETKSEVIGVFSNRQQCEEVSEAYTSRTQCYFLDPQKGLMEIAPQDTPSSNMKNAATQQSPSL